MAWSGEEILAGMQYSHRCLQGTCVEPRHGIWEDDITNKARSTCKGSSHLLMLEMGISITLCSHGPQPCLSAALEVKDNSDPRVAPLPGFPQPPLPPQQQQPPKEVWEKDGDELDLWVNEDPTLLEEF